MRLCHVSPHLPPDQAANSLLPAQLGAWGAEAGHEITFVTQYPAQGRTERRAASRPGPSRQRPTVLVSDRSIPASRLVDPRARRHRGA